MGLFDRFKKTTAEQAAPESIEVAAAPDTLAACVEGRAVPLADVPDPVFNGGILGKGCGVWPSGGVVYAPVTGSVMATTDTNHAIGLTTSDGIEVLIHIGIDTVEMKGEGFVRLVEQGDAVETGQPLLTFDRDKIKAAGHDDVVIMVVSNTAEFADVKVLESDDVDAGSPLLQVVRK